jgi:hypothetical protein
MLHRDTTNEWSKELQGAFLERVDQVPAGWLTSAEVGKAFGLQRPQTMKSLAVLRDCGKVEMKVFSVVVNKEFSLVRRTVHYRLTKKKAVPPKPPKKNFKGWDNARKKYLGTIATSYRPPLNKKTAY